MGSAQRLNADLTGRRGRKDTQRTQKRQIQNAEKTNTKKLKLIAQILIF
jgi:hypothetical protein